MMSTIAGVMLAVGNSLAASILAKVTLTTALALMGTRLSRRSRAAVRHVLLTAAFGVLLVLPIASIVAPTVRVAVPAAVQEAIAPLDVEPMVDVMPSTASTVVMPPAAAQSSWPSLTSMLVAGWIAGTALFLLPVVAGSWQVRSLRRSGRPWPKGQSVVNRLALEIDLRRRVDLLLHDLIPGPMTCGVVHPVIVLPEDARRWSNEDLHRAIVHELEHVRRGDWVSQYLARAVGACYWFHPLVWIAWRQLVLEAERACDDAVLRRSEATAYADQLVVLAERLSTATKAPLLAMASRADLTTRVGAVLDNRQPRGRAGAFSVALAGVAAALLVTTMSPLRMVSASAFAGAQATADKSAAVAGAQATAEMPTSAKATAAKPRFDAASIKPCVPEEPPPGGGRARGSAGGTNAATSPGRFNVPCVTLEQLIYLAYASYGAREDERLANDYLGTASDDKKVRGGPAWVHSYKDKFAIEATAPGVSDRMILMGTMLRTLLEERFHLEIHRESEDVPMYALRVARSGFKLKPMKEGDCDKNAAGTPPPWTTTPCGFMTNTSGTDGANTKWHYVGFQLSFLARQLSGAVGRHVIDETGVPGEFIIDLEFVPDEATPLAAAGDPATAESATPGASIFTALEQQLGLKLEKTKGPSGHIVIDRAERPTPNSGEPIPPARASGAGARR